MALGDIKGELIANINKETKKGIFTDKYTWATSIEDDFLDIALCSGSSNFQAIKIVYPNQNLSYSELNYIIDKSMIFPIFITNKFFNLHKVVTVAEVNALQIDFSIDNTYIVSYGRFIEVKSEL